MEVSVEKRGDDRRWPERLGKFLAEHLEHVDHAIPDLESTSTPAARALLRELHGIVEHRLAVADLDQQRRQAREFGVQRRGQRIARSPSRPDSSSPAPGSSTAGGSDPPRRGSHSSPRWPPDRSMATSTLPPQATEDRVRAKPARGEPRLPPAESPANATLSGFNPCPSIQS